MDYLHSETIPDVGPERPAGLQRGILELLETLVLAMILFVGINMVTARILVQSISMQPGLREDDMVLVNRLAYRLGDPKRGDIIVFLNPVNPEDVPYIKRVIGLPGETVMIDQGLVYIDGRILREPYLETVTQRGGTWHVALDSLFVMGDNRNNSSDSRQWGMVAMESVLGRAEAIYWPPADWRILHVNAAEAAQP
jgi:signal peptidase I